MFCPRRRQENSFCNKLTFRKDAGFSLMSSNLLALTVIATSSIYAKVLVLLLLLISRFCICSLIKSHGGTLDY